MLLTAESWGTVNSRLGGLKAQFSGDYRWIERFAENPKLDRVLVAHNATYLAANRGSMLFRFARAYCASSISPFKSSIARKCLAAADSVSRLPLA